MATPEVRDRLVALIQAGNYDSVACAAAGVSHRTFKQWVLRGERGDPEWAGFAGRVGRARAAGEAVNVAVVTAAARESWQAAAWLLERVAPERWAKPSQRDRLPDDPPPVDELTALDELAERRARAG